MQPVTAQQSRDARRELGLSQADVSKQIGVPRQYFSDLETGHSNRLTLSQLKKLRAYYEAKIAYANANGESITLTFGEPDKDSSPTVQTPAPYQAVAPYRFIPIYLEADQPSVIKTQNIIQDNDARISVLLQQAATRNDGFLCNGEFTEDTNEAFHEVFTLMAANYALWRSLSGWPALGLSPASDDIETIRDVVFESFSDQFKNAGLFVEPSNTTIDDSDDEEESA